MHTCGMVTLLPESELPRWHGKVVVSGLLAIPKLGRRQRLIVGGSHGDRLGDGPLPTRTGPGLRGDEGSVTLIRLPAGSLVKELIRGPAGRLSIQLDDLREYHSLLKGPDRMIADGALGLPLTVAVPEDRLATAGEH